MNALIPAAMARRLMASMLTKTLATAAAPPHRILGAKDEADAVRIANDTPYGLAG